MAGVASESSGAKRGAASAACPISVGSSSHRGRSYDVSAFTTWLQRADADPARALPRISRSLGHWNLTGRQRALTETELCPVPFGQSLTGCCSARWWPRGAGERVNASIWTPAALPMGSRTPQRDRSCSAIGTTGRVLFGQVIISHATPRGRHASRRQKDLRHELLAAGCIWCARD